MVVVVAFWFILQIWINFKKIQIYIIIEWPKTYTKLFVTSLIPSTICAANINKHLVFPQHCAWDHKVKLYKLDIKKVALMRKKCKQIEFYKVTDARERAPRAVGNTGRI